MCGIAGVLRLDGARAEQHVVEAMVAAERHRGPDDAGVWVDREVGLGNCRLSIIGLGASGHQPLCNEDGSVWITFNGEIYNFPEIRELLVSAGHIFRSSTDTEAVVHAYEEWGPEHFLDRLNGMFGLAVWDIRLRRLVLARDRLGIKPVYVEHTVDQVTFASELNALSCARKEAVQFDPDGLDAYFAVGYVPQPTTIWKNVSCLPPGTIQIWQDGVSRSHRYWQLRPGMRPGPRTFGESVEAVRAELHRSVRRHLLSDVPVGVLLSGGVDSAGVAAIASSASMTPIKAFSVGFGRRDFDELPAARLVAQRWGLEHYTRIVEPDVWNLVPRLAWQYGQPFADSSALGVALVSELAAEHVKVVLSGDGGDEVFGGYPTYTATQLVGAYHRLPKPGRALLRALVERLPVTHGKVTSAEKARRFVAAADLPADAAHLRWRQYWTEDERARLLGSAPTHIEALLAPALTEAARFEGLDRYLALDVTTHLPSDMLIKVDVASMMYSLEARVPLLDYELVELAFSLPAHAKRRAGVGKRVLRAALSGLVPAELLRARKQGFNLPIAAWLSGPLLQPVQELLRPGGSRGMDFVDSAFVARLLDEHVARRADHSYRLWSLLLFCLWYERLPIETPALVG